MPSPDTITVPQLLRLVGTPDAPVIVDVRIDEDFHLDSRLIPGSFRNPFTGTAELASRFAGRKIVAVCQKGLKLSEGAAAMLRSLGVDAEHLEGGIAGWRDAGAPLVPLSRVPERKADGHTLWVTRHRPKIDRIACPWLIRRFVDPGARFLFVSPPEVENVADRFGATPFDVEGVFWSHRGENCTFDTMIGEFELTTGPLLQLAAIVRGADTSRHDLAPQAAGLLAVSLGLSRMYKSDLAQLEAGMTIYDAFYRWCRDATDETHNWPVPARGGQ